MKFVHTADWQIGMKAAHVGAAGERVRKARIETVRDIIAIAREYNVDFILVAGDIFENNAVDQLFVQKIADILSVSKIPVFILPGNHDPFVPGSVWEHPAWNFSRNIHILSERKPIEVPGGILYPCPVFQKYSRRDPTAWIRECDKIGDNIKIGIAHGTVEGVNTEESDHPIPRDAPRKCNLNYLALGHWHSTVIYGDENGSGTMAYSGTHETTKFGERDSGNVLVVEIESNTAPPRINPVRVGKLSWKVLEKELVAPGELTDLRKNIEKMEYPENTLLDLRLEGILFCHEQSEIKRIEDILTSRFLFGRLDLSHTVPSDTDENWVKNLPPGVIRETANILRNLSDSNFAGNRPDWVTPEIASRALLELYSLVAEVPE